MALNGRVRPGDTVVVVGTGPIGLAGILTARLFSPEHRRARQARVLKMVSAGQLDTGHPPVPLEDIMQAYDVFSRPIGDRRAEGGAVAGVTAQQVVDSCCPRAAGVRSIVDPLSGPVQR